MAALSALLSKSDGGSVLVRGGGKLSDGTTPDSVTDRVSLCLSDKDLSFCELGIRDLFGGGRKSGGLAPCLLASVGRGGGLEARGRRFCAASSDSVRLGRGGKA